MMVSGLLNGFPARHGGTPIAGWFLVEIPHLQMDDLEIFRVFRGTPILGTPTYFHRISQPPFFSRTHMD